MKTSKVTSVSVAAAAVAAIALSGSPVAQSAAVQPFGTREILADPGGMMVTAYTVTGLAPSSDVIPYRVMGRLYEANVTVEAERGTITPVIPPFTARAADGQSYPVLAGVPTALGLNPRSLMQGQRDIGKLYFDVVGTVPNSVAYQVGTMGDVLLWVGSPAAAAPAPAPAAPAPAAPVMPPPAAAPMPAVPPPPPMPAVPMPPPPPAAPMMPPAPGTPGY